MRLIKRGYPVTRRGLFLIAFGLVFVFLGLSYLVISPGQHQLVVRGLRLAVDVLPLAAWGWLWIGAGIVTAVGGLSYRLHPYGFAVAVTLPLVWTVIYMAAWIDGDLVRGWVNALLFAAVAAAIAIVAGIPEIPRGAR